MLAALIRQNVGPFFPTWGLKSADTFQRKVAVDFRVRHYRVKTVESSAELNQILTLRRSVFHYEFARKWISLKSDQDAFDTHADHLAIFDEAAGKVAGVYRLILSTNTRHFYSNTEFDIGRFLLVPGTKLELSRACINREYRNGVVISLLWKGIADYAKEAKADWLFGLSSIGTVDVAKIAAVQAHFAAEGLVTDDYGITPRLKYQIPGFAQAMRDAEAGAVDAVPSLFKSYIKAGAKVCSQPVIDRDFNCADWLTVLSLRSLASSYERKYMKS